MIDPQYALQNALVTALRNPGIVVNNQAVPIYEHVPQKAPAPYVVLTQPTFVLAGGSQDCRIWNCTYLLLIITSFTSADALNSKQMLGISAAVAERLEDKRLPLDGGYGMSPVQIAMYTDAVETVDTVYYKIRRLRIETQLYSSKSLQTVDI